MVRSFNESKTTEVQTLNVGFTSEVSDYLVVHTGPGVSWAASLSLSSWVPGQGLTCDTGPWLSEGVTNPCPACLEDFIYC